MVSKDSLIPCGKCKSQCEPKPELELNGRYYCCISEFEEAKNNTL